MAYNTMIKLCAETRQYERAMTFLDDMDMKDIRPSRITMETLIRAAATAPQWIRVIVAPRGMKSVFWQVLGCAPPAPRFVLFGVVGKHGTRSPIN